MRPLIALTALAGLFAIVGCGGGSADESPAGIVGEATVSEESTSAPVTASPAEFADVSAPAAGEAFGGEGFAEGAEMELPAGGEAFARSKSAPTSPEMDKSIRGDSTRSGRQKQIQSGTLTAGSLNDHDGYDEFLKYVQTARQRATGQILTAFDGRRIPIQVVSAQGSPIANARVSIAALESPLDEQDGDQQLRYGDGESKPRAMISLRTGSDGQTALVPSLDGAGSATSFVITVTTAEGTTATQQVSLNQTPWTIEVDQAGRALPRQLDLALIIDTTGSMGDELAYLKVEIDNIAARINRLFPDVDQRYALILYRDNGDEYVTRTFDFTGSINEFRTQLSRQQAAGGGDYPEAMQEALQQSTKLTWREGSAARVAFLVGDAPPHAQHIDRTLDAVMNLRKKEVTLFPIAASGARDEAEYVMRVSAFLTQGQYLFLTDHSSVGNPHAKPTAPKYNVERLDQLMVRMVATELAGEPVLARDIIAVEESGGPLTLPIQPLEQASLDPEVQCCEVMPVEMNCGPPIAFLTTAYGRPVFGICCLAALVFFEIRFARRA
jgi:hypothetical protein